MNYVIDTSILIDISKARTSARAWISSLVERGDTLGTCGVIVAEFFAGLPPEHHALWFQVFGSFEYWEITPSVAVQAGQYRYEQGRRGRTIDTADALIAAVAANNGATIITRSVSDFVMPGVRVEPPAPAG